MADVTEIVVGVDGSEGGDAALAWAVQEGARRGWNVTALLAWDFLDQHHPDRAERIEPGYGEADATAALDAYVVHAVGPDAAGSIGRRVVCDHPAQALVDASVGAGLVVVGARGLGRFRGALVGSVSQRCAQHARCPVAIIREQPSTAGSSAERRIVVGVDGSSPSRQALHWAIADARVTGATVEAIHAWSPVLGGEPFFSAGIDTAELQGHEQAVLDGTVGAEDERGLARPVQRILAEGDAARTLLDAANGADLLVVGSRGRGGFAGLLLGSVSQKAIHHATCPVVVVPGGDEG